MSTVLIVIALVLALIAALLGFGAFSTSGDPHVLGWVAASLAAWYGSHLVP